MNRFFVVIFLPVLMFSCQSPEKVKYERYRVGGERLYLEHCANCHQLDGKGFKKLYPPISGNSWMLDHFEQTFCLMKNGSNDSLTIEGVQYTLPMQASGLSDLEIAEVGTYIFNNFGNSKGLIDVATVEKILLNCETP